MYVTAESKNATQERTYGPILRRKLYKHFVSFGQVILNLFLAQKHWCTKEKEQVTLANGDKNGQDVCNTACTKVIFR